MKWLSWEIKKLRSLHSKMSNGELVAELPRHTLAAIKTMACELGLRRQRAPKIRKPRKWQTICATHRPVIFKGPTA